MTDQQLLRIPNLGLKTLLEIRYALAHLDLSSTKPYDTVVELPPKREPVEQTTEKEATKKYDSLEEELRDAVSIRSDRNADVVAIRCGFYGELPKTLQETGDKFGITRERVRQICDKARKTILRSKPEMRLLKQAVTLVRRHLPTHADCLEQKLVESGLTRVRFRLESLQEAESFFLSKSSFAIVWCGNERLVFAVSSGALPAQEVELLPQKVVSAAYRAIEHWGASTITHIATQLTTVYSKYPRFTISDDIITVILRTRPDFQWLDEAAGWFWLSSVPRNRLLNQIEKILAVAPNGLDISELRSGVARNYRMEGFAPPKKVLIELCHQAALGRADETRICSQVSLHLDDVLVGGELLIAEVLRKHGPVLPRDRLEALCIAKGLNRSTFFVYIGYSPVIARYARGVYGLRGAAVDPATIELLRPVSKRKDGRLADYGWEGSRCWMKYQLSKAALESGVISVPAGVKRFVSGEYQLKSRDGASVGRLVAKNYSAWGLGPFFRRSGGEAGDYLVLSFDNGKREARISIVDHSLLDETLELPAESERESRKREDRD